MVAGSKNWCPIVVQRVVADAEGRIDALANVAGIMDSFQPVHELDDGTWERVLDVNLTAVAPGGTRTNIHAEFKSQLAAEVLGPIMQANVPPIAEAGEVAAGIAFLLSRDGTNINGVVLASDNGWNAV